MNGGTRSESTTARDPRCASQLVSVTHHWRTNLAVVLGVAAAVSVLAGALLVGDSVRGSLRDIALGRLGDTDHGCQHVDRVLPRRTLADRLPRAACPRAIADAARRSRTAS